MGALSFIPILGELINLIPSGDKRAELTAQLQSAELEIAKGQTEVNKQEAASSNLFVSGWRPFVGWICGLGLAWSVVGPSFGFQVANVETLLTVLFGMLGLGALRTVEKVKGVR